MFRILLPFFVNDHFCDSYSDALLTGDVEWVIVGEKEGGNQVEDDDQYLLERKKKSKRYSLQIADEEEM